MVLRANGCCSDIIPITGVSVLAGCTTSASLSRAYLHDVVAPRPWDDGHRIGRHVDDLSQTVIANTEHGVIRRARLEGSKLAESLRNSGLKISVKSVVVASSSRLAHAVAQGLKSSDGIALRVASQTEDPGVGFAAGGRRSTQALRGRIAKGLRRSARVKLLTRVDSAAAKLYRTGVKPQQNYGASIVGAAPTQISDMRKAAVMSVTPAGLQACPTTLLAWRIGGTPIPP